MTVVWQPIRSWKSILAPGSLWGILRRLVAGFAAAGVALGGCADAPEDPSLLARVDQVRIEAADLERFEAGLPEARKPERGDVEAHLGYLQNLIDRQVLLAEARTRGLDDDAWVRERLAEQEESRLAEAMLQSQVLAHCRVDGKEIRDTFTQAGWDEQVVSEEIFVPDMERAREALDLLDQGTTFAEVARQYSVDRFLEVPLGSPQQFAYSPGDGPREVVSAVFALAEGGITQPIPFRQGYVIARVVERRKVELTAVRDKIERALKKAMGKSLLEGYLRRLGEELELTANPEGMALVVRALGHSGGLDSLDAAQRETPVYTFADAAVDVQEVVERVGPDAQQWPQIDEALIRGELKDEILPEKVMAADGRRQGVDQTEEWRQWRLKARENLMLIRIRTRLLKDRLEVRQEDLESYYEQHKQQFRISAWARLEELLVEDPALAERLVEQCAAGEDLGALIEKHSVRQNAPDGMLQVYASQKTLYGEAWMNAAMNGPLGVVQGPIQTKGGYSIFRVLEREPESYYPLEGTRVRRAVYREVKREKERRIFNQYMEELRDQRAAEIEVFEENLRHWATDAGE